LRFRHIRLKPDNASSEATTMSVNIVANAKILVKFVTGDEDNIPRNRVDSATTNGSAGIISSKSEAAIKLLYRIPLRLILLR
jgi:hypothetical protein